VRQRRKFEISSVDKKGLDIGNDARPFVFDLVAVSSCIPVSELFHIYDCAVNVPKIARTVHKFDGNFPAPEIRSNVDHAAFAFFFGHDVHKQESLPGFHFRFQLKDSTMNAYGIRFGGVAEGTIVRRTSVNSNGDGHL
jgi:hypothetical protein